MKQLGANGAATPDDEDAEQEDKAMALPVRKHPAVSRSMSPATARDRENGMGSVSTGMAAGAARDSFLNYFFGKEGGLPSGAPGMPPSSSGGPQRHVSHSVEPSFAQSIRRMERGSFTDRSPAYPPPMNDDYAPASEYGEPASLFPEQSAEPVLTDREALETELIRRLISSYFNIVRETTADQVPKAIMHLLVNHSRDEVQNRLVSELYKEELFNDLLYEDDGIKKEREKCEKLLATYKEAARIVGEVL